MRGLHRVVDLAPHVGPGRVVKVEIASTESFRDVLAYATAHGVNNRIASYMLAVDRVAYTTKQRGMYA